MQVNVDKFLAMTALLALGAMPACTIEATTDATGSDGHRGQRRHGDRRLGRYHHRRRERRIGWHRRRGGVDSRWLRGELGHRRIDRRWCGASRSLTPTSWATRRTAARPAFLMIRPTRASKVPAASAARCRRRPTFALDDAGAEGGTEGEALFLCKYFAAQYKAAAFKELFDCLKAIPAGQGCATAAADACSTKVLSRTTCTRPQLDGN